MQQRMDMENTSDKWILCKDKLPVFGQSVIICTGSRSTAEGYLTTKSGSVIGVPDYEWVQFRWGIRLPFEEVVKWQQMPEP